MLKIPVQGKSLKNFLHLSQEAKNDEQLRALIKKVYETIRENSSLTYVDETGNLVLTKPDWLVQTRFAEKIFAEKNYYWRRCHRWMHHHCRNWLVCEQTSMDNKGTFPEAYH